jgi:hypothetical protein
MKIIYLNSNGFIINNLVRVLVVISWPIDRLHNILKKIIIEPISRRTYYKRSDIVGFYIEGWVIFWTLVNIFVFLPSLANPSIPRIIYWLIALIFISRAADLFKILLLTNFNLIKDRQRSLSRAFILLVIAFFELGAISTSFQFIICKDFMVDGKPPLWDLAYFYSLRNMVTIGGGDIEPKCCIGFASKLFGMIRIIQPLLSVLLVSFAINNIFTWRQSHLKKPR